MNTRAIVDATLVAAVRTAEHVVPQPDVLGPRQPAPAGAPPVVLVPGFANTVESMGLWARSLTRDGYRAFVFDDPDHALGDLNHAVDRLAAFTSAVQAKTGAREVSLMGYSNGGYVVRAYANTPGAAAHIHSLVTLDTEQRGARDSATLDFLTGLPFVGKHIQNALPVAEQQTQHESEFIRKLNAAPPLPASVHLSSVYSAKTDGALDGAHNVALHGMLAGSGIPSHFWFVHGNRKAYVAARDALA